VLVALGGFALAATILILAPGPDTVLVMRNSLRGGARTGISTAAGTVTGLATWALAATLGLSSLLAASRLGYDALRLAGAAYLLWLGVTTLRKRRPAAAASEQVPDRIADPEWSWRAYGNGVVSNVCNPKIGVFFVTFLPGFIPAGVSAPQFSLLLGAWFCVETALWLVVLVWMVDHGVGWLRRDTVQRRLEKLTGVVLIAFGVRLATESR
jgi:threonine/homoserine/homoserine lactone efflux protein